jgi:hypothetical protein
VLYNPNSVLTPDMGDKIRDKKGIGLMAGIRKGSLEDEGFCDLMINILKDGLQSSQDRFDQGLLIKGGSSEVDHNHGSAEYAFTRLITESIINTEIQKYPFSEDAQVLFDLDAVNRGTYCYPKDEFGSKNSLNKERKKNILYVRVYWN